MRGGEEALMQTLRTPDDRFSNLPDYPFEPHYVEVDDGDGGVLRIHYLEEGPSNASVFLLMHGEPSWSYLSRHRVPVLAGVGARVGVPAPAGSAPPNKPADTGDYTYARH